MADFPILFTGPMVCALLSGRKQQTRRVLAPQPPKDEDFFGSSFSLEPAVADGIKMFSLDDYHRLPKHPTKWDLVGSVGVARDAGFPTVYRTKYAVGDRLWVRETWARACELDDDDQPASAQMTYYRADGEPFSRYLDPDTDQWRDGIPWRPSIFMPRALSRLTLTVTDVRVQRLQDISEADAIAEGIVHQRVITDVKCYGGPPIEIFADRYWDGTEPDEFEGHESAIDAYTALWDRINGAGSWDANPFVAAYSFHCIPKNIDTLTGDGE